MSIGFIVNLGNLRLMSGLSCAAAPTADKLAKNRAIFFKKGALHLTNTADGNKNLEVVKEVDIAKPQVAGKTDPGLKKLIDDKTNSNTTPTNYGSTITMTNGTKAATAITIHGQKISDSNLIKMFGGELIQTNDASSDNTFQANDIKSDVLASLKALQKFTEGVYEEGFNEAIKKWPKALPNLENVSVVVEDEDATDVSIIDGAKSEKKGKGLLSPAAAAAAAAGPDGKSEEGFLEFYEIKDGKKSLKKGKTFLIFGGGVLLAIVTFFAGHQIAGSGKASAANTAGDSNEGQ